MRAFIAAFAVVLAPMAQASLLITMGQHPDYTVQLPIDSSNRSGVSFSQLEHSAPQNDFTFSGNLIGYFDAFNPAIGVVWTTKAVPFVIADGPAYMAAIPAGSYPQEKPTFSPAIVVPVIPRDEPSVVLTPEPGTLLLGFIGLVLMLVRRCT